jgi:hypothetical protein
VDMTGDSVSRSVLALARIDHDNRARRLLINVALLNQIFQG